MNHLTKQLEGFRKDFPFELWHEGGMVSKNEAIEDFLTTQYTDKLKADIKKWEGMDEEEQYGMDITYGDTEHPHPSVIYGKNQVLQTLITEARTELKEIELWK